MKSLRATASFALLLLIGLAVFYFLLDQFTEAPDSLRGAHMRVHGGLIQSSPDGKLSALAIRHTARVGEVNIQYYGITITDLNQKAVAYEEFRMDGEAPPLRENPNAALRWASNSQSVSLIIDSEEVAQLKLDP